MAGTLSKTEGHGPDTVSATFTANTGRTPKVYNFTVKNTSGSKPSKQLTITEESPGLTAAFITTSLAALAVGGDLDVQFRANAKSFRFDVSNLKGIGVTVKNVNIDSTVISQTGGIYTIPEDTGALSDFVITLTITVAANGYPTAKSGTFGIVASGHAGQADVSKSIPITQPAGASTLTVTPQSATVPATGGSVELNIQSNDSWNITVN